MFWFLLPLFWIGIILCCCWGARSRFGWCGPRGFFPPPADAFGTPEAGEILRQRYARGEIDHTTFEQMRERLEGSARSHSHE